MTSRRTVASLGWCEQQRCTFRSLGGGLLPPLVSINRFLLLHLFVSGWHINTCTHRIILAVQSWLYWNDCIILLLIAPTLSLQQHERGLSTSSSFLLGLRQQLPLLLQALLPLLLLLLLLLLALLLQALLQGQQNRCHSDSRWDDRKDKSEEEQEGGGGALCFTFSCLSFSSSSSLLCRSSSSFLARSSSCKNSLIIFRYQAPIPSWSPWLRLPQCPTSFILARASCMAFTVALLGPFFFLSSSLSFSPFFFFLSFFFLSPSGSSAEGEETRHTEWHHTISCFSW